MYANKFPVMNFKSFQNMIEMKLLQQEETEIQTIHPNREQLTRRYALVPEQVKFFDYFTSIFQFIIKIRCEVQTIWRLFCFVK